MEYFAAVLLAGGGGRRMGGIDKPGILVAGRPMLARVLDAVTDAEVRVVVGPPAELPEGVLLAREDPPGGGPVAAVAAGLSKLDETGFAEDVGADHPAATVALLAADLPLLTRNSIDPLRHALHSTGADGACYVDMSGRRQRLCGVWRLGPLRHALRRLVEHRGGRLDGAAMGELQAGLTVNEVFWTGTGPPPWFDCDTEADVHRAEEWIRHDAG